MKTIKLKKGKEIVLQRKHPWIFSRAIYKTDKSIEEGQIIRLVDFQGDFLAIASYHHASIALRILSFQEEKIDRLFFNRKFNSAKKLRDSLRLPNPETNCYRIIHGEGDGLSGLIVDVYHNTAVVQCHHLGMYHLRKEITGALLDTFAPIIKNVYLKSEKLLASKNLPIQDDYLYKDTDILPNEEIVEHGVKFYVNWEEGQKTGFFLDQRENRKLLTKFTSGKKVLNCFCYTGGFSMYALKGNAAWVTSIDISEPAIEMLNRNAILNGFSNHSKSLKGDVMDFLSEHKNEQWDIVVVDPPAFAKNISKKHKAVIAYKRLNALAIKVVKSGGMLFTFSCSQAVNSELFYHTITAASIEAGRKIRVLYKLSQAPDHPVNIFHPEGSYLKGLVLYVE